ncbi:MAG: diguanylate cyclase [Firmicutes bacterium]|nr:diguanylate cyclase [Bacillota bacterium]MCL5038363.1 diguanylate cyclase [Bacillota bacterium]
MVKQDLPVGPLAKVISYFLEGADEGDTLLALLEEGMAACGASLGALLVLTRDGLSGEPVVRTAYLLGTDLDPYLDITEKALVDYVFRTGQPLVVNDLAQATPVPGLPPWWFPRLKKFLAIPLSYRGENLGQLIFGGEEGFFHKAQVKQAARVAALSSIVLGTSILLGQLRGRSQELEALNQVGAVVNRSLDVADAFPLVTERVREVLAFDGAALYLAQASLPPHRPARASSQSGGALRWQLSPVTFQGFRPELISLLKLQPGWIDLLEQVLQKGAPLFLADLLDSPLAAVAEFLRAGVRSLALVPLSTKGQPLGVLVFSRREVRPFSQTDRSFLTATAEAIAIGVYNAQLVQQLKKAFGEAVSLLSSAVDARDRWTANHSRKVAEYAELIAQEMGLAAAEVTTIKTAALLHDIGKIGIPDDILRKPGELNTAEKAIIMSHPEIGASILSKAGETFQHIAPLVRHHHEWYNGDGYPDGLSGPEAPLGAAILAVADAFEAMTAQRPYRPSLSAAAAWQELRRGQGSQFHPEVVQAFHQLWQKGKVKLPAPDNLPAPALLRMEGALRAWEVTAVLGIAQELTRVEDTPELLRSITRFYQEKLAFRRCGVVVLNSEGQVTALAENGRVWRGTLGRRPEDELSWSHCPFSPALLAALGTEPRFYENQGEKGVAVALMGKGGRLGCLYFSLSQDKSFGPGDLDLISVIAAYLGAVLETSLLLERLLSASETDPLTGLYNRRHFGKRLLEETGRAARSHSPFSLAFFDVDDMKEINDTYGHPAGDGVIQWIASFLSQNSRFGDILCRYGGDEFVAILPHTGKEQALSFCQRLARRLADQKIPVHPGLTVTRMLSYGVSTYPEDATSSEELLKISDAWMYARKEKARLQKADGN